MCVSVFAGRTCTQASGVARPERARKTASGTPRKRQSDRHSADGGTMRRHSRGTGQRAGTTRDAAARDMAVCKAREVAAINARDVAAREAVMAAAARDGGYGEAILSANAPSPFLGGFIVDFCQGG